MKTRLPILGALILAPLMLSSCTSGSTAQPESTPTPTYLNAGSSFDAPKQVELPQGSNDGVFLPKGTAFFSTVEKESTAIATPSVDPMNPAPRDTPSAAPLPAAQFEFKYKQYDGQGDGWTTKLSPTSAPSVATSNYLTSWQGKDYLVAVQEYTKDTDNPASISKGVVTQVVTADVLDPDTGKIVKSIRYESDGSVRSLKSSEGVIVMILGKDGSRTALLLNPTNGEVSDEITDFEPDTILGSVNGKFVESVDYGDDVSVAIPGGERLKGLTTYKGLVIGNKVNSGGKVLPTTVLLDGSTGKQIASMECGPLTDRGSDTSVISSGLADQQIVKSSPDGRYIVVSKALVIDTKDGKTFCGLESEKQKQLTLDAADNEGNVYGQTSDGYFKVNVASGEATALDQGNDGVHRPAFISEDGWGVFPQLGSAEKSYAIPPKE